MEQTVPRCVREPWDSAEDSQEPEALQILSSGDPGGWRLPLYPSLGQLSWDDQDVSRELLSTPCGLLRPFCPKHGPRAQIVLKSKFHGSLVSWKSWKDHL
uniref:Uncharacterized protein n=1 Tax=Sus scrofa TaxID=9823 RepID=A0A4X1SWI2_PIG